MSGDSVSPIVNTNDPFNGKLFSIDIEEIYELGKQYVEIQNVIIGYHKKAVQLQAQGLSFELVYIGENPVSCDIEGYEFQYKFESENHADVIMAFCFFISGKFTFENPVKLYNTYIDLFRGCFSKQGIDVLTEADIDVIKSKYASGSFIAKSPLVYLRTFTEQELYRDLFSFDYSSFEVEVDKKYVYLIHSRSNGYFKIGRSKDPLKRERTLQAEEPDISLLKVWEKDGVFEKFLHKKYEHLRVRGEWFKLGFKELFDIKGIDNG